MKRRRSFRLLGSVAVALLLGLLTAWLVAGALSFLDVGTAVATLRTQLSLPDSDRGVQLTLSHSGSFGRDVYTAGASQPLFLMDFHDAEESEKMLPLYLRRIVLPWAYADSSDVGSRWVEARGWPLRAFYTVRDNADFAGSKRTGGIVFPGNQEFRFGGANGYIELVAIPYQPVWTGLAVNTLFYGALWTLIIFGGRRLREKLRRRAGECVRCRYDLSGIPQGRACPECGHIVAASQN